MLEKQLQNLGIIQIKLQNYCKSKTYNEQLLQLYQTKLTKLKSQAEGINHQQNGIIINCQLLL